MNKNRKLLLAALLLIAFAAVKLVLLQWWQAQQPQAVAAQCDLTEGCTLPDGSRVRAAAVSTKKPFDIYIEHAPAGTEQVSISFSMKNMDMGFNRYMFERQPSGITACRTAADCLCRRQARFVAMVAGAAAASCGGAMRFDRGLHAAGRKPRPRRRRFNQKTV